MTTKLITIDQIISDFKEQKITGDEKLIVRAYNFATEAHRNQKRKSGESYIYHCLGTAHNLMLLRLDAETIAASILHDVLDDTDVTEKQLEREFGLNILNLVQGVSKIGKIKYRGEERAIENLRKLFMAMAQDIRVILIKLADRLHNMQTLEALPEEKQQRVARETLDIYAPIANRLGISDIRGQLEDLSFLYLQPKEHKEISEQVEAKFAKSREYFNKTIPVIKNALTEKGVRVIEIHARKKRYYSLYKKLERHDWDWHQIYDIIALRIIVPDIESCYSALGIIHKKWRPLIGRIKDYIALPKPNGYQSLHTTVFCQGGKITEFQIRTPQMHEESEYGIAAHWHYSEQRGLGSIILEKIKLGKAGPRQPTLEELTWIKQLQDWQQQRSSSQEFLDALKIDFLKHRIFVFTPKGEVIDLPEGATPVDFAYQIHSDIGDSCVGAKIDGKLSPLSAPLKNGQMIEIQTQKNKKPSRDWLKFVITSQAKSRIKSFYKQN